MIDERRIDLRLQRNGAEYLVHYVLGLWEQQIIFEFRYHLGASQTWTDNDECHSMFGEITIMLPRNEWHRIGLATN